jgi:signal transduction histidine kinase
VSDAAAYLGWILATVAAVHGIVARRTEGARRVVVARVCHELRGPLTAARLGLELGTRSGELSSGRLRAIEQELGRAALALDDLTSSRPAPRRGRPREAVDFHQLLVESVEAWQASAAADGCQLRMHWVGGRAVVAGHRLRLAQATGNLIANAIEHGGGVIEVQGRVGVGSVRLEVIDGGPGLSAPVGELARDAGGGFGLRGHGLAIASSVARAHGGRLASAPSKRGARLILELPARVQSGRLDTGKPS